MAEDYKLPYSGADIYRRLRDVDTKAVVKTITYDEYETLEEINANTLYMLTDLGEESECNIFINLNDSNEGEPNPINADTLGGKLESQLSVASAIDSNTLGGKSENELSVAKAVNSDTLEGNDVDSIINKSHPVNSVLITSTNTNPSSTLGGTWELFDKGFKQKVETFSTDYVTLNENCSAVSGNIYWHNSRIWMNISFTPTVALTDSTLQMFTFDLSKLGITGFAISNNYFSSMSDGGNVVVTYRITAAGVFSTTDVIVRGSAEASLATGYNPNVQFEIPVLYNAMLDSFCDKFYWKRVA